ARWRTDLRSPRAPGPPGRQCPGLEHPPQPHGAGRARSESDRVVRIAGRVRLGAFVTAPCDREFDERSAAESERQAHADAVLQVIEVEVADVFRHLSPLPEDGEAERIDQASFVAHAVRNRVGGSEAVVPVAPQPVFVVDVAAAQCRLEIERNRVVAGAWLADDQVRLETEAGTTQ